MKLMSLPCNLAAKKRTEQNRWIVLLNGFTGAALGSIGAAPMLLMSDDQF